jgi:hypothetical protein
MYRNFSRQLYNLEKELLEFKREAASVLPTLCYKRTAVKTVLTPHESASSSKIPVSSPVRKVIKRKQVAVDANSVLSFLSPDRKVINVDIQQITVDRNQQPVSFECFKCDWLLKRYMQLLMSVIRCLIGN